MTAEIDFLEALAVHDRWSLSLPKFQASGGESIVAPLLRTERVLADRCGMTMIAFHEVLCANRRALGGDAAAALAAVAS